MFGQAEIGMLCNRYTDALVKEYGAKRAAQQERDAVETFKVSVIDTAQRDGQIDGKNSDTRAAQRVAVLAACEDYQDALREVQATEDTAARAETLRKTVEAEIGLTKAWLYSQSGK